MMSLKSAPGLPDTCANTSAGGDPGATGGDQKHGPGMIWTCRVSGSLQGPQFGFGNLPRLRILQKCRGSQEAKVTEACAICMRERVFARTRPQLPPASSAPSWHPGGGLPAPQSSRLPFHSARTGCVCTPKLLDRLSWYLCPFSL